MFSGHTMSSTLGYFVVLHYTPKRLHIVRWFITPILFLLYFSIIISGMHYTVDVVIAYWLTSHMFWAYHTVFEMEHTQRRKSVLRHLWWFYACYWFESNVPGCKLPNEWDWFLPGPQFMVIAIKKLNNWVNKVDGQTMNDKIISEVKAAVRDFPDFPKKGILFKDIMPIFQDPGLVYGLCKVIVDYCNALADPPQVVTALEARGFLFGPQVAIELGIPFVPIRKKGKLPGETVSAEYLKEYGTDVVEIQKDAIKEGASVVILDDLLATGGTMKAAVDLVEKAGGTVSTAICIIELCELKGREKLGETNFKSFVEF